MNLHSIQVKDMWESKKEKKYLMKRLTLKEKKKKNIPEEIMKIFDLSLMNLFASELEKKNNHNFDPYILFFSEGTTAWNDAFEYSCLKLKKEKLYKYYNDLDWNESDQFDEIIYDELYKYRKKIKKIKRIYS